MRTSTVAKHGGDRSPYKITYREPDFCKHERMNKMDPKVGVCFSLALARIYPNESKRILVDLGKGND